jgi:hypothetical protein
MTVLNRRIAMPRTRTLLATLILLGIASAAGAQTALPSVEETDRGPLQQKCQQLLEALDKLGSPLPPDTERALRALLKDKEIGAAKLTADVQELLDPLCLVAVAINPESRVKALRGPALAELRRGQARVVLVKVVNEAGATPSLEVSGPQLRSAEENGPGRWLEARVLAEPPLGKTLTGVRLEYRPLRLVAHETGKREATLKFDVGQGTQDLGFRAEVPVLFTVR